MPPALFRTLADEPPGFTSTVEFENQQPAEFLVQDRIKRFPGCIGDNIALARAQSGKRRKLGCQSVQSGRNHATQRLIEITRWHDYFSSIGLCVSRYTGSSSCQ